MIGQPRRASGKSRQDPAPASGADLGSESELRMSTYGTRVVSRRWARPQAS